MEIVKEQEGPKLVLKLSGRLETVTAPQLEAEVNAITDETGELVFDFVRLEYVSSAGLRVILAAQRKMQSGGRKMSIAGANDSIRRVFQITGFDKFLNFV